MHLSHLLLAILLAVLPYLVDAADRCYVITDDPGSSWKAKSLMDKADDSTSDLYKANMVNKYKGHNYNFVATIGSNRSTFAKVDTPKGKKDRFFRMNYETQDGTELASISMTPGQYPDGCYNDQLVDTNLFDHITVQELDKASEQSDWTYFWTTYWSDVKKNFLKFKFW